MKTVLGLIGSPRKRGNCEFIIREIARHVVTPNHLRLLRIPDFDIRPCRGCYRCLYRDGACVLEDDYATVLEAMTDCDGLILASPAYMLGPNASLKRLLDRGLTLFPRADRLWGKPAVGVAVAGIAGREGYTLLGVQNYLKFAQTRIKQVAVLYGALPGEILLSAENRRVAAGMGRALFGDPVPPAGPCCPVCGGDTFRFLGNGRVRCMLCSNSGPFSVRDDLPIFHIRAAGHEMFRRPGDARRHAEWLRGMKRAFAEKKDRLKAAGSAFENQQAEWVQPAGNRSAGP